MRRRYEPPRTNQPPYRDPLGPLHRPPRASSLAVRKSMKSNRARNTSPELLLKGMLRSAGVTGFRASWDGAPGKPDFAFPALHVAVFVHGCYWHRCPECVLPRPGSHRDFWRLKFERNVARDQRKLVALKDLGWDVLVIWECELRDSPTPIIRRILRHLNDARRKEIPRSLAA